MNKAILHGEVTQKPTLNLMQNGKPITNYQIKVAKEGRPDKFDNINCTAFNEKAIYAEENLDEGVEVLITGHLQNNSYKNKQGEKVYTTEVVVETQKVTGINGKPTGSE